MDVGYIAIGIAGGSLLVAGYSLFLAIRADRRAGRAETRDERRLRHEEEAAAARRRGRPIVTQAGSGIGGSTANPVQHGYAVRNGGADSITALWLWIEDADGRTVSDRPGGPMVIAPGDPPTPMGVAVGQPLPTAEPLRLMVEWEDSDGRHVEATGINPRRHY